MKKQNNEASGHEKKPSLFNIPFAKIDNAETEMMLASTSNSLNKTKPEYHILHKYYTINPNVSGTFKRVDVNKEKM